MKPIRLQFKGINSFSEQTEIDFERLTKNGIFGIFGDTGSGKSTILDCINFALYGKVERSREKLDIINYRSEAAEVEFEFDVLTEGKRKRYSVERSIKRKSGLHKAVLYEDGNCIADNASTVTKKITEVLGVDAEDFRKCIALPQGEFSHFVKSQPSERISLIERLFSLSRYGDRLKERLKLCESQAELSYSTLKSNLEFFADVSAEIIKNIEAQIKELKKQTQNLLKENANTEKEFLQLSALSEKRAELDKIIKQSAEAKAQKPQMEKLRKDLQSVPVCKTAVEAENDLNGKISALSNAEKSLSELGNKINTQKENLAQINEKLTKDGLDEAIERCISLSAKYSACDNKPEKLSKLVSLLDVKRKEYREKGEELLKLKQALSKAEAEVKEAESKLASLGVKNLEQLINIDFKGAFLKEEYVSTLDYFAGLNGQVKFHRDDSELYKFLERELKQQIEIYKDRVYQVKDFSFAEAQRQLDNLQSANEERENLTAILNERTVAFKDAQSAVLSCEKDIAVIQRDGEELRKQADEIKAELLQTFGDIKDYAAAKRENEQALDKLRLRKSELSKDIERTNKILTELTAENAAVQADKKSFEADIVKLNEKLKAAISQSGFDGIDKCKSIVEEFSKYPDAENALKEYDLKLITLSSRRTELQKVKGIVEFSTDELKKAEEKKNGIASELSEAQAKLAVLSSDLEKAKDRLDKKKDLTEQFANAEKELNLIAQLKDLTKGNKFMEYIANEYLYDISALASSTLLNLTDGRYFLTYTDTFYAGDNFNCGNLRGVNTLSGGETFLVSLSLALALSQTICASLKSIEFFFLDEGFGTLDGTLVDTVMNALEKLKSSRFTIGVISHVEELKHRIDNKITVKKATENHGSTVQISC